MATRRTGSMVMAACTVAVPCVIGPPSAWAQTDAWNQILVSGPSARNFHTMTFDSSRGVAVLFGGYPYNNETWEWNGAAWTQRVVSGPPSDLGQAMAYDSARGVSVMFGGSWSLP